MTFHLIKLKNFSIFEQLQIEECLLRCDGRNFFIVNQGSPRHIVLGLSNQTDKHINEELIIKNNIPIIKRFSGGGSIIVDENTIFTSFICNKEVIPGKCFPETIMRWTEKFYQNALQINDFAAIENDYVIEEKKCGGNAQYITKQRLVHHTSFLWDFDPSNMQHLKIPPKTPSYRKGRSHQNFLCKLKEKITDQETMITKLNQELQNRFSIQKISIKDIKPILSKPHRKSTKKIR